MHISTCIAIITFSATFVAARPLNNNLYNIAMAESDSNVERTDLTSSGNTEADTDSNYYKEFLNTEDQQIHVGRNEKQKAQITKPSRSNEMYINMENISPKSRKQVLKNKGKAMEINELDNQGRAKDFSDNNSLPSDTKRASDIIEKPDESTVKEPYSDTTLSIGTHNAFTKNESASDTIDYANKEPIKQDSTGKPALKMTSNSNVYIPTEKVLPIQDEEQSPLFDFYDVLDRALLDPYINAIDSDLNSEVYEEPVTETITYNTPLNEVFDYHSLIAKQISLAEEQIRLKHDELLQDQQQIDDLKRKVHHSPPTTTISSSSSPYPTFSMEIVESGPNETMYVYKNTAPTITTTVEQFDISSTVISITNQLPLSTNTPLLSTQISLSSEKKEDEAEKIVPSSEINNTPLYKLVQKQTNKDYQPKIKNSSAIEAVDLVSHMSDTTFDPSNKLKLPNISWTPSRKNVSK